MELFFKWIKQHLRIKAFYGTSENAVKTQIWIAVSIYVLVAIVRKRLGLAASLYQALQILSVTLFEKTPILCALQAPDADAEFAENVNQLIMRKQRSSTVIVKKPAPNARNSRSLTKERTYPSVM